MLSVKAIAKKLPLLFAISTDEEDHHIADISYMRPDVKTLRFPQPLDKASIHITLTALLSVVLYDIKIVKYMHIYFDAACHFLPQ